MNPADIPHPLLRDYAFRNPGMVTEQGVRAGVFGAGPAEPLLAKRVKRAKVELCQPFFLAPGTWVLPLETRSEANGREWRDRSRRTQAARAAVSKAFGPTLRYIVPFAEAYHQGNAIEVRLTRLGGRHLDKVNLASSLKGVEDALAVLVAANDGDSRWVMVPCQEPGGGGLGVRVEMRILETEGEQCMTQ